MTINTCCVPRESGLDPAVVAAAYFKDAYSAPLHRAEMTMPGLFFCLFGHHPLWIKRVLILRNRIAGWCGLAVPAAADIMTPKIMSDYHVGDTIGPWPIFALSDNELVAGRDNGHLDFRLSILRITGDGAPRVVVSTICSVHNLAGKAYLFFIIPFHKWGVKRLMAAAVAAGRI
jgi:Protein of unknown function (DUF2867)